MTGFNDSGKAIRTFLIEVVTGSIVFLVIGAGAVGLGLILQAIEAVKIDPIVMGGLYLAKYGLFAADLVLFARFLYIASSKAWRNL